jgi:hypothetical protein
MEHMNQIGGKILRSRHPLAAVRKASKSFKVFNTQYSAQMAEYLTCE